MAFLLSRAVEVTLDRHATVGVWPKVSSIRSSGPRHRLARREAVDDARWNYSPSNAEIVAPNESCVQPLFVKCDGFGGFPEVVQFALRQAAAREEATAMHHLEHVFRAFDALFENCREIADALRRVGI